MIRFRNYKVMARNGFPDATVHETSIKIRKRRKIRPLVQSMQISETQLMVSDGPSLNERLGYGWYLQARDKKRWVKELEMWSIFLGSKLMLPAKKVSLIRYRGLGFVGYDKDNLIGGMKKLVDALKAVGIISNDADHDLITYGQVSVPIMEGAAILVTIDIGYNGNKN